MATFDIRLFGRLEVLRNGLVLEGLEAGRLQELLCYLLLSRGTTTSRESLASLLWGERPTAQSKRNLRQALWQLQTALEAPGGRSDGRLVQSEADWVAINPRVPFRLDVAQFERAFNAVQGVSARELDIERSRDLKQAVDLYRGDLLQGCYQDWCIFQRERLQSMFVTMLDKLVGSCEIAREYEDGIAYGNRILILDRARERTHRQLMRLHLLAGDRTGALRQYQRCAAALHEELGVRPSKRTIALYEEIRADNYPEEPAPADARPAADQEAGALRLLKALHRALIGFDRQVLNDIEAIERRSGRPV